MVYLDAYNPRARHLTGLGVHHPRHRYLTGLGAHHPRHRYLTGVGCGCGCCGSCAVTRMIGPLGDDIAPPSISAGAPSSAPSLFSTDPSFGPSGPAPPVGATYGPPLPPGYMPPPLAPVLPASATAAPVAPAISYGSPQSVSQMFASALAPQTYAAQSAASLPGTFLGIPTQYLMYGGLGLLGLTVLGSLKNGKGRRR
jgi:hypothetical protein